MRHASPCVIHWIVTSYVSHTGDKHTTVTRHTHPMHRTLMLVHMVSRLSHIKIVRVISPFMTLFFARFWWNAHGKSHTFSQLYITDIPSCMYVCGSWHNTNIMSTGSICTITYVTLPLARAKVASGDCQSKGGKGRILPQSRKLVKRLRKLVNSRDYSLPEVDHWYILRL